MLQAVYILHPDGDRTIVRGYDGLIFLMNSLETERPDANHHNSSPSDAKRHYDLRHVIVRAEGGSEKEDWAALTAHGPSHTIQTPGSRLKSGYERDFLSSAPMFPPLSGCLKIDPEVSFGLRISQFFQIGKSYLGDYSCLNRQE